jgi:hypothetical protein
MERSASQRFGDQAGTPGGRARAARRSSLPGAGRNQVGDPPEAPGSIDLTLSN